MMKGKSVEEMYEMNVLQFTAGASLKASEHYRTVRISALTIAQVMPQVGKTAAAEVYGAGDCCRDCRSFGLREDFRVKSYF
jgi:hypothetical protein